MSFGNLDEAKDAATAAATGFLGDIKQKMSKVRDDDAALLRSTDRPADLERVLFPPISNASLAHFLLLPSRPLPRSSSRSRPATPR